MDRFNGNFISTFATAENTKEATFLAAGTVVNANGNSNAIDLSSYDLAILVVDITAVSGTTPTLNLTLQTLDPATNTWVPVPGATIAQQTAVGEVAVAVNPLYGEQFRIAYTVGGTTPSFTLAVDAIAKTQ